MNLNNALIALFLATSLGACAAPGTRVNTDSDFFKASANSQRPMCAQFGCDCYINEMPASCNLVYTCTGAGSCKPKTP
jgi:hypothetical protein